MRIKNTTDIQNVRELIDFIGLSIRGKLDVMVKNGSGLAGRAYHQGSSYHSSASPFIVCRIPKKPYPRTLRTYQYAQLKNRRYYLGNRTEAILYILAHELRHIWQSQQKSKSHTLQSLGYVFGARGQFSEIDTESFAIRTLRHWRSQKRLDSDNDSETE